MTMRSSGRVRAALWAAALLLAPAVAGEPVRAGIAFAPHRAVYDLKLERSNAGSGVADVSGRIVYELTGSSCEGYAQNMRFVTQTVNQEGAAQTTDLRTSSWEAIPPLKLRFSSSTFQNEQPADQTQGVAERKGPTGPVSVHLVRPTKRTLALAGNIYFPIQHSVAVLTAAHEGKSMVTADLFDGSETGDKVYATSTVVGRPIRPGPATTLAHLKDGDKLEAVPSWPVSISYYEPGPSRADVLPLYEMSYRFHENGVTSTLMIDHGEFAIRGELKELTYLETGTCPAGKP
jgi:hypothetical protein